MEKKEKKADDTLGASSYIIGIGASAGGLEAITAFFENAPDNTAFSYVIVQHLSPDHKSLMSDLLSRHTLMKVAEAEDGMLLMPACVYLLPSKKFMTVKDGRLHLTEKVKSGLPNNAIDVFFISLAEEYKEKAIGIILSGTGTDGTKGLETIKQEGGIAVVQDPITAAFDGMPNNAIASEVADLILPPETMAEEILGFLSEPAASKTFHINGHRDEVMLRDILLIIRKNTGHDFGYYKRPTLYRRLSKRLSELNIQNIKSYLDYLNYHPEEIKTLCQEFLINVTRFFRDKEAFEVIRTKVIPAIMGDKRPGDNVKVWSVACSSGEEAYSLAILFCEYMQKHNLEDVHVKIFATDIDKEVLEKASRGIYSRNIIEDLGNDRVAKHFTAEGNEYKVSVQLRKMVVFSYHDILRDPPFSRMDLISCRNMLIYIAADSQKEILHKLHFALNMDGYLFLGSSEDVGIARPAMDEVDKKWRIYKCISKSRLSNYDSVFSAIEKRNMNFVLPQAKTKNPVHHLSDLLKETLLEQQSIAGILIDQNMDVKQATGNYKNYITLPEAGFNFNLLKLVPADLGIALSVAIRKAIKDNEPATMRKVAVHKKDRTIIVNLSVRPYLQQKEFSQQFLFIAITEEAGGVQTERIEGTPTNSITGLARIGELEKELKETRENLQAVIEEVETANEEMQSANEEMLSTNEELQSTNEELQSLNEELHTVSAEHQLKIKELMELNDDMNNFFRNSEVGQILIDRKMIIRKFSPAVTRMVNLIDTDINRSIMDITTRFNRNDFIGDIRQVMAVNLPIEREIELDTSLYLMRITPYIRQDKRADGVVVNFIDITETKKLQSILETVLDSTPSSINAKRAIRNTQGEIIDFEYIASNAALEKELGIKKGVLIGKTINTFFPQLGDEHFKLYKEVVETGHPRHYEFYDDKSDKWFDIVLVKMLDGLVTISTDITDKKKAADIIAQSYEDLKLTSGKLQNTNMELERSNMDLLQFASVASHDLKEPLRKIQTYGNMLYAKVKDKLVDGEINNLNKIIAASDRMQRLIEDVLTLSKLSNREIQLEKVDLNNVLSRILDDLEIIVREKKSDIKIGPLPIINGVTGQIHQLFQNLISNALKFSDRKKPGITITEKIITNEQAEELGIQAKDYWCISVKDNGIGFEEEYKDKIFGIFQRLHGNNYEGTGIGLAICKKIMENHHGFLLAQSRVGEGAEFFILLPK
jgi:two-component system CheB/CheR fusion protein